MSDSLKQLDKVGKLRYKEKLGMLGVITDPYRLQKKFGRMLIPFYPLHGSPNGLHDCFQFRNGKR